MKEILATFSNQTYAINDDDQLNPLLEVIIVYSDGMKYGMAKGKLTRERHIEETRFIINAEALSKLIGALQGQQIMMNALSNNAAALNTIISDLRTQNTPKPDGELPL